MVAARPCAALQPHVSRYIGYRFEGFAPGVHQGLPSRFLAVNISMAAPIRVSAMPDPGRSPGSFQAAVAGLHPGPATIAHDGDQFGISLELTPLGARSVLGVPAAALRSTVVSLEDLLQGAARELGERLALAEDWATCWRALDDVLARQPDDGGRVAPDLRRAWQRLLETGGRIPIAELARELGWSQRHFGMRFRSELGLAPKVAARVIRFDRSVSLLRRSPARPLGEVALACGYSDQSHMNRDWRALAAVPPTTWLSEAIPNVEADRGSPEVGNAQGQQRPWKRQAP